MRLSWWWLKGQGKVRKEKNVNKMKMKLAGSSENGRWRASEAKVKTRASFLKYNVLKSSQLRILMLVLRFWLLGKDHEGKARRKSW